MSNIYAIIYTKENGKQELTSEEYLFLLADDLCYHREDGPAHEILNNIKSWWVDGKRHRLDGPATIDYNGNESWWVNGKLHKLNGPALKLQSGLYWYIDSKRYSKKKFVKLIKEVKDMPLAMRLTDPRWWVREFKDID